MECIIDNLVQVFCKSNCVKQKKQVLILKQIEKFRQTNANALIFPSNLADENYYKLGFTIHTFSLSNIFIPSYDGRRALFIHVGTFSLLSFVRWRNGEDNTCPIKGILPSNEKVIGWMGGGHYSDKSFSIKCLLIGRCSDLMQR